MIVHKVDGEFHVAFGRLSKPAPGQQTHLTATQSHSTGHVHQFSFAEMEWFNASHVINHIAFALDDSPTRFPLVQSPMRRQSYTVEKDNARITYYIKIVPTTYVYASGETFDVFQVSVRRHVAPVVISRSFRQPGLFFKYEMSPYHVTNTQQRQSVWLFIARSSALVGGVYVVMGFVVMIPSWVMYVLCSCVFGKKTKTERLPSSPPLQTSGTPQ
eukprot:TRINITY_DN397_c0_g1_i3.p1 TRINITY_DN397_c0_g1~~TRINITY_DN397_c0_g1_i3.p1  ORF type:complete len:245 (-),score=76.75 TRINITY_DN397_c0_g1_i3:93-737(-)